MAEALWAILQQKTSWPHHALCHHLKCSWKDIVDLLYLWQQQGLPILIEAQHVTWQAPCLVAPDLHALGVHQHWPVVESTQDIIKTFVLEPSQSYLVTCDLQTQGYGRYQRSWQSRYGDVLLSFATLMDPALWYACAGTWSLVYAECLARHLSEELAKELSLKWPNDIMYQGRKQGGILIESARQMDHVALYVGIGLNQHLWADFGHPKRNALYGLIVQALQECTQGMPSIEQRAQALQRWSERDFLRNRLFTLEGRYGCWSGIDAEGRPLVIWKGETSPRLLELSSTHALCWVDAWDQGSIR